MHGYTGHIDTISTVIHGAALVTELLVHDLEEFAETFVKQCQSICFDVDAIQHSLTIVISSSELQLENSC